jgi:hypothetical protein
VNTPKIVGVVVAALQAQLADVATGINPRLVVLASSYDFPAFEIDFSATSTNFMLGRIDPAALQETSVFTFPFLTLDVIGAQDQRDIKFSIFSGPIMAMVEVHHSWPDEAIIADFSALVNATADAIFDCLNDIQLWPGNLLWNGKAEMRPGPLKEGGLNWLKTTQFICPFRFTV